MFYEHWRQKRYKLKTLQVLLDTCTSRMHQKLKKSVYGLYYKH